MLTQIECCLCTCAAINNLICAVVFSAFQIQYKRGHQHNPLCRNSEGGIIDNALLFTHVGFGSDADPRSHRVHQENNVRATVSDFPYYSDPLSINLSTSRRHANFYYYDDDIFPLVLFF